MTVQSCLDDLEILISEACEGDFSDTKDTRGKQKKLAEAETVFKKLAEIAESKDVAELAVYHEKQPEILQRHKRFNAERIKLQMPELAPPREFHAVYSIARDGHMKFLQNMLSFLSRNKLPKNFQPSYDDAQNALVFTGNLKAVQGCFLRMGELNLNRENLAERLPIKLIDHTASIKAPDSPTRPLLVNPDSPKSGQ